MFETIRPWIIPGLFIIALVILLFHTQILKKNEPASCKQNIFEKTTTSL